MQRNKCKSKHGERQDEKEREKEKKRNNKQTCTEQWKNGITHTLVNVSNQTEANRNRVYRMQFIELFGFIWTAI